MQHVTSFGLLRSCRDLRLNRNFGLAWLLVGKNIAFCGSRLAEIGSQNSKMANLDLSLVYIGSI